MFNHESPLRGETFVTRKITRALTKIKLGLQKKLYLGNLNAKRDWGHAKDYVEAQWMMLQQNNPEDFVIASEEQHSVREFVNLSAKKLNLDITWKGEGVKETGLIDNKEVIKIDPNYFRPSEVDDLLGNASKAKNKLGWKPKISFDKIVEEMVEEDLKLAKRDKYLFENYSVPLNN